MCIPQLQEAFDKLNYLRLIILITRTLSTLYVCSYICKIFSLCPVAQRGGQKGHVPPLELKLPLLEFLPPLENNLQKITNSYYYHVYLQGAKFSFQEGQKCPQGGQKKFSARSARRQDFCPPQQKSTLRPCLCTIVDRRME